MTTTSHRTFNHFITRVTEILSANPGAVLILDSVNGAVLDASGRVHGFVLAEGFKAGAYEFDPKAWSGEGWAGQPLDRTWGGLDMPSLIRIEEATLLDTGRGPGALAQPATRQETEVAPPGLELSPAGAGADSAAGRTGDTCAGTGSPRRYGALSINSSHLPRTDFTEDNTEAFIELWLDWTETGELWVVPPPHLRQWPYIPTWAGPLLALADQHGARYVHFEPDGPLVAGLPVYSD